LMAHSWADSSADRTCRSWTFHRSGGAGRGIGHVARSGRPGRQRSRERLI